MSADQHKGHQMDVKEFEKQMEPKAKRSRLEPFQAQIFELKEKGYANWQICKYLEDNGITISQEGLRKFIKSRDGQPVPVAPLAASNEAAKGASGLHNPKDEVPPAPAVTSAGGKARTEQVLDAPTKKFSLKQLQKDAK